MKTGFSSMLTASELDFIELAKWATLHKYDCIEVNVGPTFASFTKNRPFAGHLDLEEIVRNGPEEVNETLSRNNLFICALTPAFNLLDADLEARKQKIDYMKLTIDACSILNVLIAKTYGGSNQGMYFYGLPSVGPHPSNKVEEIIELYKRVFTPLAEYAESCGVKIALDTAPRGGGWGNIAHCPELWEKIFEAVPSPTIGLALDPSHLVWLHITHPEDVIREFGDKIFFVDAKDAEILHSNLASQGILGNNWWRYRLPGMGDLNWGKIISALKDVGYDYVISIENEDALYPGTVGVEMAHKYLMQFLTKNRQKLSPDTPLVSRKDVT